MSKKQGLAQVLGEATEDKSLHTTDPADAPNLDGLGPYLREAHRAYVRAMQDMLALEGIPIGLWNFMFVLWQEDGLSQKDLCRRVGTVDAAAVNILAQLEDRG